MEIKINRIRQGMTQKELAKKVGISVSYLSLIERTNKDLKLYLMQRISEALNIDIAELFFKDYI